MTESAEDIAYLEKHKIRELLADVTTALMTSKPRDPVKFMIDKLAFEDPSDALQDSQGLSKLMEIFRKNGWEGRQYVPAEPVLQLLRLMGKPDREIGAEIRETAEFKEEFLVKLFGEAFWSKSNAEFDLIVDSVLKGPNGAVAVAGECDGSGERKTKLILYSKPGCHLCEGLEEKLRETIASGVLRSVEEIVVRDISTNTEWWSAYQLEVPVMTIDVDSVEKQLPRQSPRLSAERVGQAIQKAVEELIGGHDTTHGKGSGGGSGSDPYSLQPVDWRKKL